MRFEVAAFGLFFVSVLCPLSHAQRPAQSEHDKIKSLIEHVKGLQDATFIRNGKEYDAVSAAKFLRYKWDDLDAQVKTAVDFIEKVASYSANSGQYYQIRFKDGTQVKSGDYLRQVLKKLERQN